MKAMTASHAEDALTQLANRFAHWRQSRATRRARIPQALWDQAVALTGRATHVTCGQASRALSE